MDSSPQTRRLGTGVVRREIEPVISGADSPVPDDYRDWWRLFVAIELPKKVMSTLDQMARTMRQSTFRGDVRRRPSRGGRAYDAVRWTSPENMHVTLKFLGDVHRDDLSYLKEELDIVASDSGKLQLSLGANGCFPGDLTPRVLWTGMNGDLRRLQGLAVRLEGAMVRCGFDEDRRDFMPHVTVGRVRSGTQKRILSAIGSRWLEARSAVDVSNPRDRDIVPVSSFALMRSHLHHNRPTRYERLHVSTLS